MKRTLINMAVLGSILGASMAHAGGWDRSGQDTSIIMKEGSLLELTSISVAPKVTGENRVLATGSTGDVTPDYSYTNIGFRTDINDDFSLAVIQEEPFGASVDWTESGGAYQQAGVKAKIETDSTTVLVGYDLNDITLFGGIKNQSFGAEAVTSSGPSRQYTITSTPDSSLGYVIGAGFEKPEIALKVSLSYHAKVNHQVSVVETVVAALNPVEASPSTLAASTPSSFNLTFQSGIAENTLLFGSVRSVKWTETDLRPTVYAAETGDSLKKFDKDVLTYNLGVARKFTDQWSGAFTYGTEAAEGGTQSPLGPTDGFSKMGLAVTYSAEQADITLGMQQVNNGDTQMNYATMTDNTTTVTAVKVAYKF